MLVGDGGFQMTGMEVATLVRYKLDAIVVVLNNGGYRSLEALGGREKFCQVSSWDYVAVAEALGVVGIRAQSPDEFGAALMTAGWVSLSLGFVGASLPILPISGRDPPRPPKRALH